MKVKNRVLCKYCKGPEFFQTERRASRWGVRCQLTSGLPIRGFDTQEQAQQSIDEWCTGDGRRACRPYLLKETGHSYSFGGDLLREFEAMEEHTVAKQTYYCKCGKTFQKSSTAQDTGYRLDDYGEQHECYGCPFVEPVTDGWGDTLWVKTHECRASAEKVKYTTTASMALDSDCVARVYTLDMPWLDYFINFYLDTPGCGRSVTARDPEKLEKAFRNANLVNGRRSYSFEFEKNKRGRAARQIVYDKFFDDKGKAYQLGCGPSDGKVRVLQMIECAKQEAREDVHQVEEKIFGVDSDMAEEDEGMAKLDIPKPDESTCPYYNGIEQTYSPRGYCISCQSNQGWNQPYDLKSWALDAVNKLCLDKESYSKCNFFNLAQRGKSQPTLNLQESPPVQPTPQEVAPIITTEQRSITDVTAEIRFYKAQTVQNIIEIGKRLNEAKAMLEHGQWGEWLEQSVNISRRMAQNFMKIANEYSNTNPGSYLEGDKSNSSPVTNLSYSNLLLLLTVPTEERDEFMEVTHTVDGVEKTVDEMSKRELQKVIKERDEALLAAKNSELDALGRRKELVEKSKELREARNRNQRLQRDLDELESRPVDVAVAQPSEEQLEEMRSQIREELATNNANLSRVITPLDDAEIIFMDALTGAKAMFFGAVSQMEATTIVQKLEVCISSAEYLIKELHDSLNKLKG